MPCARRLVVSVAAACVLGVVSAQGQSTPAPPQTMGQLALMVVNPSPQVLPALRVALTSTDPGLRAVAARLIGVSRFEQLAPDLATAYTIEQDTDVAEELTRALLLLDLPDALATVRRHLLTRGSGAIRAYVFWLVRTSPEQLNEQLLPLIDRGADDVLVHAIRIVRNTNRPAASDLVRTWLRFAPIPQRAAILPAVDIEALDQDLLSLLIAASEEADADLREAVVWAGLEWLSNGRRIPAAFLDALAAASKLDPTGQEVTWEQFGRELVARVHRGVQTPDRTSYLATSTRGRLPPQPWWPKVLSKNELEAWRANDRDGQNTFDTAVRALPPAFEPAALGLRTVEPLWPGFLPSLLSAAGCPLQKSFVFGGVELTYRPDGRPLSASTDLGGLHEKCSAVLSAIVRTTLADSIVSGGSQQTEFVLLPVQQDYVRCLDASYVPRSISQVSSATPHARRVRTGTGAVTTPKKIHDVRPIYPASARQNRRQGIVILEGHIAPEGCLNSLKLLRGVDPMLDLAAMIAVSQWRYSPAKINGVPVEVILTVTVNFSLR